jgi:hypothetical protein
MKIHQDDEEQKRLARKAQITNGLLSNQIFIAGYGQTRQDLAILWQPYRATGLYLSLFSLLAFCYVSPSFFDG